MQQKTLFPLISYLIVLMLALSACTLPDGSGTPAVVETPSGEGGNSDEPVFGDAPVDAIEARVVEQPTLRVEVIVRGSFPDGCTVLTDPMIGFDNQQFTVQLRSSRPANLACPQVITPYEHSFAIEMNNVPAGIYPLVVNGISTTFALTEAQVNASVTPTPTGQPAADGSISGVVWHDLCAIGSGEGDAVIPSAECVGTLESGYKANGTLEDNEPLLEGVEVRLSQGPCPGTTLGTTLTDAEGKFSFEDLADGQYCISIDAASGVNANLLIPGDWTSPEISGEASAVASRMVEIVSGAQVAAGQDFGWDYQFLPEAEPQANCTNRVEFVEDITYPDDSPVASGENFTKTWKLRNSGTCTWTAAYALVFFQGEGMQAASPQALTNAVRPDEEVEFSISMVAPEEPGTYRSEWRLRSPDGNSFGTGRNGDGSFWVQVTVVETVADLGLGSPDRTISFNSASDWFLLDFANTKFTIENGDLVMKSLQPGNLDEWGLANNDSLSDFYIEMTAETGDVCASNDRYGLLLRAPDPGKGYVFGFTCDGRFRIYTWDGTNYSAVQEWKSSAYINKGPNQTNRLGFYADGSTIKVYANGNLLGEYTSTTFSQGRFGAFIAAGVSQNFEVRVKEVAYWELD